MAVNGFSFDEVGLPNPPTYVEGQPIDYVTVKLPTFLKSQYIALLDFISASVIGELSSFISTLKDFLYTF